MYNSKLSYVLLHYTRGEAVEASVYRTAGWSCQDKAFIRPRNCWSGTAVWRGKEFKQVLCLFMQHSEVLSFCSWTDLLVCMNPSSSISPILRAEELFQQGLQNLSETDKSICQVFHLRYADFHLYHNKQEAKAINHYTKVGLCLHACC